MSRLPGHERKRQIAETALVILATEGPARLTAKHIGEQIGISDAAVFRHFDDKQAIIDAAIARFEDLLRHPPAGRDTRSLDRLRHFVVQRIARVRERPEVLSLAFNNRLADVAGEEGAQRVRRVVKRSMATVRKAVREAQSDGSLNPDVPADMLVWIVQGVVRGAARSPKARAPEAIFNDLLVALSATPPSAASGRRSRS